MSTRPRVSSAMQGQPAHMVSAMMHQPELARKLDRIYRVAWGEGVVDNRIKEVARIRNARLVDCGACQNVRLDAPRNGGLGEDVVDDINDDYRRSDRLTEQEKAALALADALLYDPARIDEQTVSQIREHFTDEQIVELGFEIAKLCAVAKLIITMGMEPENPVPGTVIPTPGKVHGLLTQEALQGALR